MRSAPLCQPLDKQCTIVYAPTEPRVPPSSGTMPSYDIFRANRRRRRAYALVRQATGLLYSRNCFPDCCRLAPPRSHRQKDEGERKRERETESSIFRDISRAHELNSEFRVSPLRRDYRANARLFVYLFAKQLSSVVISVRMSNEVLKFFVTDSKRIDFHSSEIALTMLLF